MKSNISRFDHWFALSYYRIRNKLGCYLYLDQDVFHDTYLLIRRNLLFEKNELLDFEPYFIGCYKKKYQKCTKDEQRYYHPEDVFFQMLIDKESAPTEDLLALDNLAHDILSFVKNKFPESDYKLFKLRNFETLCSYKDLSDYTGISNSVIHRKIKTITKTVRENHYFADRISQLIATNHH